MGLDADRTGIRYHASISSFLRVQLGMGLALIHPVIPSLLEGVRIYGSRLMTATRNWIRDNSTLVYFLIAQFIAIGAGAASILAYAVKLETRVYIMEHRGAEYTVARMEEMKLKIAILEQGIRQNEEQIKRIVDALTREIGRKP